MRKKWHLGDIRYDTEGNMERKISKTKWKKIGIIKQVPCPNWERCRDPKTGRYESRQHGQYREFIGEQEKLLMFGSRTEKVSNLQGIINQIIKRDEGVY